MKHMQHSMPTAQITLILEKDNTLCVLQEKNRSAESDGPKSEFDKELTICAQAMAEVVMPVGVLNAEESSSGEVFSPLFLSHCSRKLLII